MAVAPWRWSWCWHHRTAGRPVAQSCSRGRLAAVGGALLAAILSASCTSNDSPDATANPPSTTLAATTTAATAAGQTVSGTGYSVTLPARWSDITAEMKNQGQLVDLAASGPRTEGILTNFNVVLVEGAEETLAEVVTLARSKLDQSLPDARPLGQPERLSVAGAPAMAHEYTWNAKVRPARARQIFCQRGGRLYAINFAAPQQAFTAHRAAFEQLLASWSWD
jgi:hypothetical protein